MLVNFPIDDQLTNGYHYSYWVDSIEPLKFKTMQKDVGADVLVVGGGIAGLTTAYCLAQSGKKVILVEDGYLGSGETGRTTAHITYVLDEGYVKLEELFGKEKAKLIAQSHKHALEWIERVVESENIDCDFKKVNAYLFAHPTDTIAHLGQEFEAAKKINLPVQMLDQVPGLLSYGKKRKAIVFPEQGQFHSLKYLKGLAHAILEKGGEIYTQTHVDEITCKGAKANGFFIQANHVVVATNSPVNNRWLIHNKQVAYRTYVIAVKIRKNTLPYAIWWDTGNQHAKWLFKPYHYVRLQPLDENFDLLIVGGEDHQIGRAEEEHVNESDRYDKLIAWTHQYVTPFFEIAYQWSGQVLEPVDALAFMGKNPGDENIYIITGDSGNGITHGTIGAILVHDLIMGNSNPYIDLYDPGRLTLGASLEYVKEISKMGVKMGLGWLLSRAKFKKVSALENCQGAIFSEGTHKIAAYKDEEGMIHLCSGVCPHLGGVLQWNDDEKSFDCPIHGSRFTPFGTVINGPANCNLSKR